MILNQTNINNPCIRCAKCVPYCTIYQVNRDETTSPRGFNSLSYAYNDYTLKLNDNLKNIFDSCFCCTDCTTRCPIVIDTANIVIQMRIQSTQKFGIKLYKKFYFYILKNRKLMDVVFSIIYFISPCLFNKNNDKLRSKIKISKFGKRTIFPFNKKSFLQQTPKLLLSDNKTKDKTVAIFIGCLSNYNYKEVGNSLLTILNILGIDVLIPKQECCGAPAYFSGDVKSVNYLIKKNIILFEEIINKVDAIITPEATCAAMILKNWKQSLSYDIDSKEWIKRLDRLLPKIYIATKYLYDKTPLLDILNKKNKEKTTITYHDPCHAKKVLGIYKEPRAFIKTNYNLIEMEECDRCCGFGGVTIQKEKYELAYNASLPKAKYIKDSKAKIVSAECNACRMQLNNAIDNYNIDTIFKHPLELIEQILINN